MKVQDVMTEGPASIRSTTPVREAIDVLQSLNARHLPIVDGHGELVGILSDRDLRMFWSPDIGSETRPDLMARLETPVCRVMCTVLFAVHPESDVRDVIDLMIDQKIGAVPVLDSEGGLIGIVSYVDLLRELRVLAADVSTEGVGN
ncbi:MAG TPA: CBS domain-containing protein [Polyangiaceae bacterium]